MRIGSAPGYILAKINPGAINAGAALRSNHAAKR